MEYVMNKEDLKHRARQFALRVIRMVESLSKGQTASVIGKQLLRSGTVGWYAHFGRLMISYVDAEISYPGSNTRFSMTKSEGHGLRNE